ncbi:MAG TPA: creatininase family protein [archaeon]|nr:creatininase family protein [archaeon]
MERVTRRNFLAGAIGGSAALGASSVSGALPSGKSSAAPASGAQGSPGKRFTRRMEEMTSREVEFYLKDGGGLVFIPFGPVSGHGAFIPMGMHALWATALSVLMAEKADGLVFPPTYTVMAGATQTFRGTVHFPVGEQVSILKRIARSLNDAGFRRVVLVGGTTPENTGGIVAVRELFDETGKPFWFIEGERVLSAPEVKAVYEGYPGNFGETLLCLAAMKILGCERPIPAPEWAREIESKRDGKGDQPDEIRNDVVALRTWGQVGFKYYEEGNHGNHGTAGIVYKGRLDVDMAVEVLEKCADFLAPILAKLSHYADWLDQHPFQYIRASERLNER